MKRLAALAALILLTACGQSERDQESARELSEATRELGEAVDQARLLTGEPVSLSDDDKGRVCRAAIASLNGRDPAIIRVVSNEGDTYRVRYTRDDGTVWTNDCRVGDGTAEWRMVENGQPGRWRSEDTIRYSIDGASVSIDTFMGAEPMTSDTYEIN